VFAAVCALTIVAAACGGGSTTTAPTTTSTAANSRAAALAAYTTCMKDHGVTLPAGAGGFGFGGGGRRGGGTTVPGSPSSVPRTFPSTTLPAGVTESQYQAALTACRSTLPTGGGGFANSPAAAAYRNCLNGYLSAHGGTTLPANGGFGGGASGVTSTTNPLMAGARTACAALLPTRGSTTTTPTTA
jgi:hypothetical protein